MSGKTAIQYYIPEDGDDLEHPNILLIEKEASKITLGDIRKVYVLFLYDLRFSLFQVLIISVLKDHSKRIGVFMN